MKPFEARTSKSIRHCLKVIKEDFNMRKKNFLKKETLEDLELAIPISLADKKVLLNTELSF